MVILDCCHSGAFKGGSMPTQLRGSGASCSSSRRGQSATAGEGGLVGSCVRAAGGQYVLVGCDGGHDGRIVAEAYAGGFCPPYTLPFPCPRRFDGLGGCIGPG